MIPFSIAFRIDNKLFNIILKLSISWTVNRRKSQFLRKRIDLFKLILKWYFKVPPPNQLSIANMSIYGCQRFVYNLNINKNFKFYWKSFPSEKDCKKWNYFSMAPWWRSALPAAQPRWARGGRRGRRAKPADDAGFFKGKEIIPQTSENLYEKEAEISGLGEHIGICRPHFWMQVVPGNRHHLGPSHLKHRSYSKCFRRELDPFLC